MTVTVRLFARARDLVGSGAVTLRLQRGSTVGELKSVLARKYPAIEALVPKLLVAVNNDYAGDSHPLEGGVEVACFPPVSGG